LGSRCTPKSISFRGMTGCLQLWLIFTIARKALPAIVQRKEIT
jgi:hypothetical protein